MLSPGEPDLPDAADRQIRFSAQYYDRVRDGRKTATTRLDDPCHLGPVWLVFEFDDRYRRLAGFVEAITTKRFDELSDIDAHREDCRVADDLKTLLRNHYPDIVDDDLVDVVRFRLAGEQ